MVLTKQNKTIWLVAEEDSQSHMVHCSGQSSYYMAASWQTEW